MPTSIFDLVKSDALVAYWETLATQQPPYLGEELFPAQQKLGLDLKWIKGAKGLPVVLLPSAYDVKAKKRDRIGFDKLSAEMPYFKESSSIDEEMRQQLNMVIATGNQAYIDSVTNNVFDDEMRLLTGARAQRERMRMQALTTGAISISANGQDYDYDYQIPENHKSTVTTSWSDAAATIIDDIRESLDTIEEDTGVRPTRAICSSKTWGYFRKNNEIRNAINGNSSNVPVTDAKIRSYISEELEIEIVTYSKKYRDEHGNEQKFVDDDIFVMFPSGALGTSWFGTTPEQSDLMSGSTANVTITDVGVAVTTTKETDPVNVDTKVSMIFLPSFEAANSVFILDVNVA